MLFPPFHPSRHEKLLELARLESGTFEQSSRGCVCGTLYREFKLQKERAPLDTDIFCLVGFGGSTQYTQELTLRLILWRLLCSESFLLAISLPLPLKNCLVLLFLQLPLPFSLLSFFLARSCYVCV